MFAIMYKTNEEMNIRLCNTLDEVRAQAARLACMGCEVTVFDYDVETKTYFEFFTN